MRVVARLATTELVTISLAVAKKTFLTHFSEVVDVLDCALPGSGMTIGSSALRKGLCPTPWTWGICIRSFRFWCRAEDMVGTQSALLWVSAKPWSRWDMQEQKQELLLENHRLCQVGRDPIRIIKTNSLLLPGPQSGYQESHAEIPWSLTILVP